MANCTFSVFYSTLLHLPHLRSTIFGWYRDDRFPFPGPGEYLHKYYWPVVPTGRSFGRISQKGQNKKWSGRTNLRPNFLSILNKKGRKRDANFLKSVSLLLSSLILGKSKNYYYLQITQTKIVFFFSPNSFKKWNYFLQRPNFSSELAEKKFSKELATLLLTNFYHLKNYSELEKWSQLLLDKWSFACGQWGKPSPGGDRPPAGGQEHQRPLARSGTNQGQGPAA
jgi:hypothetical protein